MDDRSRSESFLEKLVGVASVSGHENACLQVCEALMREVGLTTRRRPCPGVDGAYNVEGVVGTGKPKLVLTGHIDTVPIEGMTVNHLGERRGNRYYGRGTTDMKGGLAAMLAALDRLHRAGTRLGGELVVVATVYEETLKCGGYQVAIDHTDADAVVCSEPTECRIAIGATGNLPVRLDVTGKAGHTSVPGSGGNAILGALICAKAIVDDMAETVQVPHIGARRRALGPGFIRGGLSQTVVPEHCTVWMESRYFPGETAEALIARMNTICARALADHPNLKAVVSGERLDFHGNAYQPGSWGHFICVERGLKPLLTDPEASIVRVFQDALQAEGGNPEPEMMYGWGDIEFLANDHKVPALYFGPGSVKAAHTVDEHVDLDSYDVAVRVYERAIVEFLGSSAARR
jgi:acetylornithine deacetylase/succinyl-diaminopimelate desuccinylase-like protein